MPRPDHPRRAGLQDHGGNRAEVLARYGLDRVLDFSASINPLGHPEGLQEWIQDRWEEVLHYPDRNAGGFLAALADRYGVPCSSLLAGNGSAELLDLLLRALEPSRVVLSPPDFGLYRRLVPRGIPILEVPRALPAAFALDSGALARQLRGGDLLLLSNPANPSGCLSPREEILALRDRCREVGAIIAVDEAFCDFCPEATVLPDAAQARELVVLRSLTKFYGIPGLRLGFLVASADLAARVASLQVPWSVNALAQAAGVFCLTRQGWARQTLDYVEHARSLLREGIEGLTGARPLPSRANYLLVELSSPAPGASELYDALARRGFLVRHCGSFGLGDRFVRLAVRTIGENRALLRVLHGLWAEQSLEARPAPPATGAPVR